jgi:hypothetical protein
MPKATCEVEPEVKVVEKSDTEVELYTDEAVLRLTGEVKNHMKTDVIKVFGNRYRINVWTEERRADRLISHFQIPKSFFVSLEDGEFVDRTIARKVKPGGKTNIFST